MPIWEDASLIGDDSKDYGYTSDDALKFLTALSRRLQVDASFIIAAYEDVFYYLWKERRLPVNVDPLDSKLEDPIERRRVARLFEQGLGKVDRLRASAPPDTDQIGRSPLDQPAVVSRIEGNVSHPGDSPVGYRLPFESLPWTKPEDVTYTYDADPFEKRSEPARKAGT